MENANDFNLESQEKLDENKVEDTVKTVKKNNKIGPFIAALVVLLGISAVAIAFTIAKKDSNLNKPQVTSTVTEDKDEISEVTSTAIKHRIDSTVDSLHLVTYDDNYNEKYSDVVRANYIYTKNGEFFKNAKLSDDEKLFTVLSKVRLNKEYKAATEEDYESEALREQIDKNQISKQSFLENAKKIQANDLIQKYTEIFAEDEIENKSVLECGANAIFDKETLEYFFNVGGGCGGADMRSIIISKDKYQQKGDDEYYLDVTVATTYDGMTNDGKTVCAVFNAFYDIDVREWGHDLDDSRINKECKSGANNSELKELMAGTGTKYRYTFDKEYRFKGIEKL